MDDRRAGRPEYLLLIDVARYSLLFALLGAMLSALLEFSDVFGLAEASLAHARSHAAWAGHAGAIASGAALGGISGALSALTFFRRDD